MSIARSTLLTTLLSLSLSATAADVDALLAQMTLDEKLTFLHGGHDDQPALGLDGAGYIPGVERLGIPPLRLTDGPAGIRTRAPATALPAPVALAASFDRDLARRYGAVMGSEGLVRHQQVLLGPMVNLVRVPQAGRNFESFGEDPLLAGEIAAAQIGGVQDQGMMATVKHYAANNQEQDRLSIDANVDERTLRELYLPAFERAVQAGVASVMCAYNRVGGRFSCENALLLQQILRQEWGFKGFVMTDWWAMHSLDALQSGLNMEMPGWTHPEYPVHIHFDEPLREAVEAGRLAMVDVDAAVKPILAMMDRFGLLDGKPAPAPLSDADNHATALATALAGAVLLKNDGDALPLAPAALTRTLLLGPTATTTLIGGGGSSRVPASAHDSTLGALQQLAGTAPRWLPGYDLDGTAIPAAAWRQKGSRSQGLYYIDHRGRRHAEPTLDYTGNRALRGPGVRTWEADLLPPETGTYTLLLQTSGPTASLYHDDERLLYNDGGVVSSALLLPTQTGLRNAVTELTLEQGKPYRLKVQAWTGDDEPVQLRLAWQTPSQRAAAIDEATQAAASADHVIVFAHVEATETSDRPSLALPGYQDALIQRLANDNKGKVSVVLNSGAPVLMPWADDVAAILQLWYPGQAGGDATARLLLGLANPAGKLPVTFPRSEADTPLTDPLRYPGVDGKQAYAEGLFMGYRWYDARDIAPLFPFGHGLSYTRFDYSDAQASINGSDINISFTLRNSGTRAGAEVPQLYVEHEDNTTVLTELRKLAGFDKVWLEPGESRRVSFTVTPRQLSWWNPGVHHWQPLPGNKLFRIGSSSRDLRVQARFLYSPQP